MQITDDIIESALVAFWCEPKPDITMRERMRAALEAALKAKHGNARELPEASACIAAQSAEIARLREALGKIVKHAENKGMRDWPIFKNARAALETKGSTP